MITLHKIPLEVSVINKRTLHFILAWQALYFNRFPLRVRNEEIEYQEVRYEDPIWTRLSYNEITSWIEDYPLHESQIIFSRINQNLISLL